MAHIRHSKIFVLNCDDRTTKPLLMKYRYDTNGVRRRSTL